jgi:anti-sigma factor RsiW
MSCSVDLKAYFLGELAPAERAPVEKHVNACQNCREELERLKVTQAALLSFEDQDPPQRIAFVSDKVFEPRWYETIWRSGPVMGFASAAVLAVAILVHAFARPVVTQQVPGQVDTAQIEQRIEQEVNTRLDAAVAKAVSVAEARQDQRTTQILDAAEKRYEVQRRRDLADAQQAVDYYGQKLNRLLVASNVRSGQ